MNTAEAGIGATIYRRWRFIILLGLVSSFVALFPAIGLADSLPTDNAVMPAASPVENELSPYWSTDVTDVAAEIVPLAYLNGFHPDFLAAIIDYEMNIAGQTAYDSLFFPSQTATADMANEHGKSLLAKRQWALTILSYTVQQTGGDLHAALRVFYGGWGQLENIDSGNLAVSILDNYARAIVVAAGLTPDSSREWVVAVDVVNNNLPLESPVYLGGRPLMSKDYVADQIVYLSNNHINQPFVVHALVIPADLSEGRVAEVTPPIPSNQLESLLRLRSGEKVYPGRSGSSRFLVACLVSWNRFGLSGASTLLPPAACPSIESSK